MATGQRDGLPGLARSCSKKKQETIYEKFKYIQCAQLLSKSAMQLSGYRIERIALSIGLVVISQTCGNPPSSPLPAPPSTAICYIEQIERRQVNIDVKQSNLCSPVIYAGYN
jgi:hypothetical protein